MDLGPLTNMPDFFPESILEDPNGFKTVAHARGYFPRAHKSGWRTSTRRPYIVTYSYEAITVRKVPRGQRCMVETEREIDSGENVTVEVHRLAYMPPARTSGWFTCILPAYIITYCWDYDPEMKLQGGEDTKDNTYVKESEGDEDETREETDDDSATDLQDNNKEERGVPTYGADVSKIITQAQDNEPNQNTAISWELPSRPRHIGLREMREIYYGMLWLGSES